MVGSFLTSDLDAILNTGDFAVVGELIPADGSDNRQITGIFDDEDVEIEAQRGMELVKSARIMVKTSECIKDRDRIIIPPHLPMFSGGDFRVAVIQDDGTGMTTLHLERVPDGS